MSEPAASHPTYDPEWELLLERITTEGRPGERQAIEEVTSLLGMPPSIIDSISEALLEALRAGRQQDDRMRRGAPVSLRVWITRGVRDEPTLIGPEACNAEVNKSSGWGFFLIQQPAPAPGCASAVPHRFIELFLYRERDPRGGTRSI